MRTIVSWLALPVMLAAFYPAISNAEDAHDSRIRIESAWARASIGTSRPAAAYVTLVNERDEPVTLTGVSSPVAGRAAVHETVRKEGVMRMIPAESIEIEPGHRIEMKPGGFHIMLMDLKQAFRKGESFDIVFRFADGTALSVPASVLGPGSMGPGQ